MLALRQSVKHPLRGVYPRARFPALASVGGRSPLSPLGHAPALLPQIRFYATSEPPIVPPPPAEQPADAPPASPADAPSAPVSDAPTEHLADGEPIMGPTPAERAHASFWISNLLPVRLGSWDPRPHLATLREETVLEQLASITREVRGHHGFRVESWEVARKDGGVFCHFSYNPPLADSLPPAEEEAGAFHTPEDVIPDPTSPASLFLPKLNEAAAKQGGWPSWLGKWWRGWTTRMATPAVRSSNKAGHHLYRGDLGALEASEVEAAVEEGAKEGDSPEVLEARLNQWCLQGWEQVAGSGCVWVVRGRQWTEDMNRFPSNRLRVEFDGPDVSQEMIYRLFRPYGRVLDILPPSPVPAGSLRYATLHFSRIGTAVVGKKCLHGFRSPTNSTDYTLVRTAKEEGTQSTDVPLTRLRIYYDRPINGNMVKNWISAHPRIALPIIAFLVGTLSYIIFDPIRSFFVRSEVEGVWDLEKYAAVKFIRDKVYNPIKNMMSFGKDIRKRRKDVDDLGRASWKDRLEAERNVTRWLNEYPSTFTVMTGPPGSGKHDLCERILKQEKKPALVIDCSVIAKSKTDQQLVANMANETGYWPVFSFLQSINGLIDLASVGLIGQKAGFSTPVDEQLRAILDVVATALREVATHTMEDRLEQQEHKNDLINMAAARAHELQLMKLGVWHDGRLDCVAGNGIMSELGFGIEAPSVDDLSVLPAPVMDGNAPIDGEGVPPSIAAFDNVLAAAQDVEVPDTDLDPEGETIKTLPIVVLRNFDCKRARGDVWNVLAEWGASLIENKIAHVIVVGEGSLAGKTLTTALPSKPLNMVALSDADDHNSLEFVREKLSTVDHPADLDSEDRADIAKLGGRMIDLEGLVYKVRSGQTIRAAVHDIVLRNVVEIRKQAFGDDAEDAKHLPWTRAQAWKIVTELAKKPELSYAKLLQDFPFKGNEAALKAMEEHELIVISMREGRPSQVRPGKPVFRQAFESLVNDDVFRAFTQIEYNNALTAKSESDISAIEVELAKLKEIVDGGDVLEVATGGWFGHGSAVQQRVQYLLTKMAARVKKIQNADKDSAEQMKWFSPN